MPFANIQTCYLLNYSIKIKLATEEGNGRNERWTLKKTRNWSSCTKFAPSVSCTHDLFDDDLNSWPDIYTKLALRVSWTHGVIAQSVSRTEFSGHGFKSHSGQLSITTSKKSFRDEYCMYQFIPLQRDDLCETSLKSKCGDWRRQRPEWNVNTEQRDAIGVAVQSWLWEWVELMVWWLSWLEPLNGTQWSWVEIPLGPTYYSYF